MKRRRRHGAPCRRISHHLRRFRREVQRRRRPDFHPADRGNKLPVFSEDPNLSSGSPARLTGELRDDGKTLALKAPTNPNDLKTSICGLPKYNGNGEVVSYTVTEEWSTNNDQTDYVKTITGPNYDEVTVGYRHFIDNVSYEVRNSLVGTGDAVFYKLWNDHYVRDSSTPGQRPDISLDLYRASDAPDAELEKVDGYIKWSWEALQEGEGENAETSQYQWKATAPSLPKYDADGYTYTYYAVERIPEVAKSLDYQDVTFELGEKGLASEDSSLETPEGLSDVGLWKLDGNTWMPVTSEDQSEPSGSSYAMHECGTFVNSLANTQFINDIKLWQDVPGEIVDDGDLPKILVVVQRRLMSTNSDVPAEEWGGVYVTKDDEDKWVPKTEGDTEDSSLRATSGRMR